MTRSSTEAQGGPRTEAGWQDRLFARFWSHLADGVDALFGPQKDQVLIDLPTRILEIGPGLGANFDRYAAGASVLAFEPNLAMHSGLRASAAAAGIELEIRADDLRDAVLESEQFDAIVSTLVLCSVGDQRSMVREIHRLLKPGGRFLFVEHVASANRRIARIQRLIRRPWGLVGDGCDPAPDTVDAIESVGFSELHVQRAVIGSTLNPAHPVYWGIAVR